MTRDQLIAEITSGGFSQYDEAGLIDYQSLKRWIRIELKRFGGNLMHTYEKTIRVSNGKAHLPEGFWKLELALSCEPEGYKTDCCEEDKHKLLQTFFGYKERVEAEKEWDNLSSSWQWDKAKFIKEEIVFEDKRIDFFYKKPQVLRLKKGFVREACTGTCKNLNRRYTHSSPYEINKVGDYLQTNFKSGYIYLQYKGLHTVDEDLWIPETQHNRIEEYLIYYCRRRILEDIIVGDDDPNKATLLGYYVTREQQAFALAMTESKFEGLGPNWSEKVVRQRKLESRKYNIMLPTIG